jgi:hypothetical protein
LPLLYARNADGALPEGSLGKAVSVAVLRVYCRECGLMTEYTDPRGERAEYGPSWPFEVGEADMPGLASMPLEPVVACGCRIGKIVEERELPCERFSPGC